MKECPNCKASISDSVKFCMECGFNVKQYEEEQQKSKHCPQCGAEISGGKFCPECGCKLNADAPPALSGSENFLSDDWLEGLKELTANDVREKMERDAKERIALAFANFEYEEHVDGTFTVTGLKDASAININVPNGVVAIAENAFAESKAINVELPEGLQLIEKRAFYGCKSLNKINLPDTLVEIGDEAFADCIKLNATAPAGAYLGANVFANTAGEKALEEAKRKAEEEERKRKEAEAKRKAEEEAKRKAEEEAKRKAEEEAKRKAEEEARKKTEEERKRKEAEAKKKAEEEAKRKAEEDRKRKAEEEARRKIEEAERKKAEEARLKREAEEYAKKRARIDEEKKKLAPLIREIGAAATFSTVKFGRYPQNTMSPEPIEWIVIRKYCGMALLLSKNVLDCCNYGLENVWEDSSIRTWLDEDFASAAFTEAELEMINVGRISTRSGMDSQTETETYDRVFLLDHNEVSAYFNFLTKRHLIGRATPYAQTQGVYVEKKESNWWLRCTHTEREGWSYVNYLHAVMGGKVMSYNRKSNSETLLNKVGVRPAIWIKYE